METVSSKFIGELQYLKKLIPIGENKLMLMLLYLMHFRVTW